VNAAPPGDLPLKALLPEELKEYFVSRGEKGFRALQLFTWLHRRRIEAFEEMTDFSKNLRAELAAREKAVHLSLLKTHQAEDGTIKFVFATADAMAVESVFIPEQERNTLCISSQVGCAFGCAFCFTGQLKFRRNLGAAEIVDQVYLAENFLLKKLGEKEGKVTNLVYMGMGEPLHNYDQVVRSAKLLLAKQGRNFSTRHITISTAGVADKIEQLGHDLGVNLAVSLNAADDETRNLLMPINKRWPLHDLFAALRRYPLKKTRRITFEYVLIEGINDSTEQAKKAVSWLRSIPSKVNLLPLNPIPGSIWNPPAADKVDSFQKTLIEGGLSVFIRTRRGVEIGAACGMLGAASISPPPAFNAQGLHEDEK
jgi:23S rRNA (adenine2503-C2)-methyltransferase